MYAALAAPGGANDIATFGKTQVSKMIQNLPLRKFFIGENAYVCSETLLTPFSGLEKDKPAKDELNFYLSQLRIHIEQTFGMMTTKWGILHQLLQVRLKNVGKIFMCITRLHNFCINEGCVISNSEENLEHDVGYILTDITKADFSGNSVLCDLIVQELFQRELERPTFN